MALNRAQFPTHHIHTLNRKRLINMASRALESDALPAPHICESMAWLDRLFLKPELCLYITLVRDPIARNLSAFFENIETNIGLDAASRGTPEDLLSWFTTKYNHEFPLNWFNLEFRDQLGINVFSQPFDQEKKYVHIPGSNVLIFRVDCEDDVVASVLSRALGRHLEIGKENVSAEKKYSKLYSSVKKIAKFPAPFVEKMYNNDFVRHFWSTEETENFKARWTKP